MRSAGGVVPGGTHKINNGGVVLAEWVGERGGQPTHDFGAHLSTTNDLGSLDLRRLQRERGMRQRVTAEIDDI
jgi:hypothetical protein